MTQGAPESAEYRALVDAALAEYARGNWTEAYALFVRAHALEPSARTLRGLAVCAFEAKQYLRAIEMLRAALVDPRKPLSDEQRDQATTLIARAQVFLGRMRVVVEPAAARIEVDSYPATRDEQGRVLLDPGPHQLSFAHPGYLTETRAVRINPGDEPALVVELAPSVPATSASPAPERSPYAPSVPGTSQAPSAQRDDGTTRVWAWVSAAGSLALVGAGTTMFVLGQDGVRDVERACPPDACSSREIERMIDGEGLELLQVGSIAAFVLAGAGAIASVVLFASDGPSEVERGSALAPLRARF